MKEKFKLLIEILSKNKYVLIYLYNVKYIIYIEDNEYIIKQWNSDYYYTYSDINKLFTSFKIYGLSIIECLENLVIIEG